MQIETILKETSCQDNTNYIQNAIDHCSDGGGGRVILGAGNYNCGTIFLKANVTLHLEEFALLSGSPEIDAYPLPENTFIDAVGQIRGRALVIAENIDNVAITGKGTIDGNGSVFRSGRPGFEGKPFLVRFVNCRNVYLESINLFRSSAWTLHLQECDNVTIKNVQVDSRVNSNNDGIDIDSCSNVNIIDCNINSHDDAICLKTTTSKACENILIRNCVLSSDAGGVKLGTESYGDMRKITVYGCIVEYGGLGAVKIISTDGAVIEDISVSNMTVKKSTGPIFIRLGNRGNTYREGHPKKSAGTIRRIKISNLNAKVVIPESTYYISEEDVPHRAFSGVIITGIPKAKIEDITLEDINIDFYGGGQSSDINIKLEEQETGYPEQFFFGITPASCFYLRHIDSVIFNNVKAEVQIKDKRPAVYSEDVTNIKAENCQFPEPQSAKSFENIELDTELVQNS